MFFIVGISTKQKELDYNQMLICDSCGQYGRYIVFMTYTVFTLFFIPIFKWNKRYYVQTSCCKTLCQLDSNIGKQIEYGQAVTIQSSHLHVLHKNNIKICSYCGYQTSEDFKYCPKCGHKL